MLRVYLAGAIEKSPDGGRSIRYNIKEILADLPLKLIDPCDFEINSEYKSLSEAKKKGADWRKMAEVIITKDLSAIENCDILLAIITEEAGLGTFSEIVYAKFQQKPVVAYFTDDVFRDDDLHIWVQAAITDVIHDDPEKLKKLFKFHVAYEKARSAK